jgi:hypothetical protein
MKKIKLHKWSALFFVFLITAVSCNQKSFPVNSNSTDDKNESAAVAGSPVPPAVITISDEKASTNKEGELYYDDENGYRYWRYSDGKYYLDRKYDKGSNPKKKTTTRKKARKNRNNAEGSEYASN